MPYRNISQPIAEFRDAAAYVLLGDPGVGKTTTFEEEARLTGGHYMMARDFDTFDISQEKNPGKTLYIDGLDDIRIRSTDGLEALDTIRAKLAQLGKPRFRIACRTAQWYGSANRESIKAISPNGEVQVLLLDPISDGDIQTLLIQNHDIDADAFLHTAKKAGSIDLAGNPLNLSFLAKLFADGQTPENGMQLWDRVSTKLLEENNATTDYSYMDEARSALLMRRAEFLFAHFHLSEISGYALSHLAVPGFPRLQDLPTKDTSGLRRILDSRLFKANSEQCVVPALRKVSEFLSARHVASLLEKGLPLERVLALVTDEGGRLVPDFGNFVAWLTEFCPAHRIQLIELASTEILANAEVTSFTSAEKHHLLNGVADEVATRRSHYSSILASPHLGGLITSDREGYVLKVLQSPKRNKRQAIKVSILAEALCKSDEARWAAEPLIEVVQDPAWDLPVRLHALEAVLVLHEKSDYPTGDVLIELTEQIAHRPESKERQVILGRLLLKLYPSVLIPSAIVRYLNKPLALKDTGYTRFWAGVVQTRSNVKQLTELLNALADQHRKVQRYDQQLTQTIQELLLITLGNHLAQLMQHNTIRQCAAWLCLACRALVSRTFAFGAFQPETNIKEFLAKHRTLQEELNRQPDCSFALELLLGPPTNEYSEEISHGDILPEHLNGALSPTKQEAPRDLLAQSIQKAEGQKAVTKTLPLTQFGQEIHSALQQNEPKALPFSPEAQNRLAWSYLGLADEAGALAPVTRLHNLLGGKFAFICQVRRELKDFVRTAPVPNINEILHLFLNHRMPTQTFPLMAGMNELHSSGWDDAFLSDNKRLQSVIAIYLCARRHLPQGPSSTPAWFNKICEHHPDIITRVYVPFAAASWKIMDWPPSELTYLLHDPKRESVARKIALPLLRKLPVRSNHNFSLGILLYAALKLCEPEELIGIAKDKIDTRSMTVSQRVYWLSAALFADSGRFVNQLERFVAGKQKRVDLFVKAVGWFIDTGMHRLDIRALSAMVRLVGPHYDPRHFGDDSTLAQWSEASCIRIALDALETMPVDRAKAALDTLANDAALKAWKPQILEAASHQQKLASQLSYRYAPMEKVAQILSSGAPTGAADLAAITVA